MNTSVGIKHSIQRIRVDKLFGRYTYDLQVDKRFASKLMILYGDNGSGKTTILRLMFYLLTHYEGTGYKTFIARTPFRRVAIDLGSGTEVGAVRRGASLIGAFRGYIKRRGRIVKSLLFKVDKENAIRAGELGYQKEFRGFLRIIRQLDIGLFFVTDDRELLSDAFQSKLDKDEQVVVYSPEIAVRRLLRPPGEPPDKRKPIDIALDEAIRVALEWTKGQVLSGSKQGEADANTLYTSIVKRLSGPSTRSESTEQPNMGALIRTLEHQARRSRDFAQFGFPFAINLDELIRCMRNARRGIPTIYRIVKPYVNSITAKLDALQAIQQSISVFVATVNSFFEDKVVSFDLQTGIGVLPEDGSKLLPSALSSGEKQLLLLFCNTLIAKRESSILFIDEPEISLNIKWQRRLVRSLLTAASGSNVQFVFATHSFELLAPHEESVVQLINLKGKKTGATSKAHS